MAPDLKSSFWFCLCHHYCTSSMASWIRVNIAVSGSSLNLFTVWILSTGMREDRKKKIYICRKKEILQTVLWFRLIDQYWYWSFHDVTSLSYCTTFTKRGGGIWTPWIPFVSMPCPRMPWRGAEECEQMFSSYIFWRTFRIRKRARDRIVADGVLSY